MISHIIKESGRPLAPPMTDTELAEHWQNLKECEAGGAKPAVYRRLLEEISRLREHPDPSPFCDKMDRWAALAVEQQRSLTPNFPQHWQAVRLAIYKSCLLDRMLYGGESPSQTPCPVHKGRWGGVSIHPGDQWVDAKGNTTPAAPDSVRQDEYEAGCRCFQHKHCRCTTGWMPDQHCGCISEPRSVG